MCQYSGEVDPHLTTFRTTKKERETFGRPNQACKPSTNEFLQSKSRQPTLPPPSKPRREKDRRKPPVPTRDEKPPLGLHSGKNYITANAVQAILAEPKKVGHEEPKPTERGTYGKVPGYLRRIKTEMEREREMAAEAHSRADEGGTGNLRKLSDEERDELVYRLKMKWEQVNEAYQKLPFTIDTPQRKARKEQMEHELRQLEHDIEALDRKTVVVAEDE